MDVCIAVAFSICSAGIGGSDRSKFSESEGENLDEAIPKRNFCVASAFDRAERGWEKKT